MIIGVYLMTIYELVEWYIRSKESRLAPRTIEQYKSLLEQYCSRQELNEEEIEACYNGLIVRGHTRTAQLVYKLIRAACRKGMRYRKISYDPTAYIDPVEHFPQMREYWSTEEAKTFLRATEGTEMHIIWLLMLGLGLRRGEVCGLRWRDVDLKRGKIHVCNQVYRIDGQLIDGPPKSRTSDRVIVIPELIRKELTEYRKTRLTSRYVYDNTPERLRREFRIAVAGAQLRPISLHGLRHTFAAIAVESGESLKVIQYVLGHADYRVTEKVYAHVSEVAIKGAVTGVSGALHSDS